MHDWFWNAAQDGGGWSAEPTVFTQEEVQRYSKQKPCYKNKYKNIRINHICCSSSVDAVVNGTPIDTYHNGSNMIASVS